MEKSFLIILLTARKLSFATENNPHASDLNVFSFHFFGANEFARPSLRFCM